MRWLGLVLLGGVLWMGLQGQVEWSSFLVGGVLGAVVASSLRLSPRRALALGRDLRGLGILARLYGRFVVELAVANVQQLRMILSPRLEIRPRWVRFSTRLRSPASRKLLGVLISMTPGTVTENLVENELTIHVLSSPSEEAVVSHIRESFEEPLLELETL